MKKESDGVYKPHFKDYISFFIGDIKICIKQLRYIHKLRFKRAKKRGVFYMVFEPFRGHPGLADRLKAIINTYNLAKSNGYDFKIYYTTPFKLSDYLTPNKDWECSIEELEYSLQDTKFFREISWRERTKLKPNKQYHCYYYCGNTMPRILPHTGYKWCDLFKELFTPSTNLVNAYKELNIPPRTYISVHIRFVNALEQFENTFFDNHLKEQSQRDALIQRCKNGIRSIIKENKETPIYVFSDSKVFLNSLGDLPVYTLDNSEIKHISSTSGDSSTLKTFLDLYVMSQSQTIYRFCAPELYSISHYALLAATIGDIPFYDLDV
ncbi:MAG: hypothetical protein J6J37_00890 [Bacteroidaceae bacterium]|nr:hypothetical protein [Bacteroidaceae bacterium]